MPKGKKGTSKIPPENTTAISTMQMSQAEFGTALITEAQNRLQKQRLEKSVEAASVILKSIEYCDTRIDYFSGWKKTRAGQLQALKNGAFSFDKSGDIVYDDMFLNRK